MLGGAPLVTQYNQHLLLLLLLLLLLPPLQDWS
jgi:hypothetical protein